MDMKIINSALNLLVNYTKRNEITSKPNEIVECSPEKEGFLGVACMWNELGKRTAVKLNRGSSQETAEIRRRFEEVVGT